MVKVPVTVSTLERVWVAQSWLLFEALQRYMSARQLPIKGSLLGKTNGFPDGRVNFLNEGSKGTRLGITKDGLKVLSAASSYIGDDGGNIVVGAWSKRAEAFQPGISRGDNGFTSPLQKNLKEAIGVETRGLRVGGDGKDGVLALSGNVAVWTGLSDPARKSRYTWRMDKPGLSECAANNRRNK